MKFWLDHPAAKNPASLRRWLAFRIGGWMQHVGQRLEWWALDPDDPERLPF